MLKFAVSTLVILLGFSVYPGKFNYNRPFTKKKLQYSYNSTLNWKILNMQLVVQMCNDFKLVKGTRDFTVYWATIKQARHLIGIQCQLH